MKVAEQDGFIQFFGSVDGKFEQVKSIELGENRQF